MTILICACLVAGAAASSRAELSGRDVLKRMLEAEGKVSFIAHEVTTLARGPALTSEQTVYRAGFRGMRMEYLEPPAMKGEIRTDDGKVLAHYIPSDKVLKLRPSRIAGVREWTGHHERFSEHENLEVQLVGRDKIAGRDAYVIAIQPHFRKPGPTRKFWVDASKWVKLKTEEIAPSGTVLSTSYFTKIDFVSSIPNEKFHIEPPPGVRIEREEEHPRFGSIKEARRQVDFKILEPTYLPSGFKLAGAGVIPFRDGKIVVLRYTDGVGTLSLFQTTGDKLSPKFLEHLRHGPSRSGGEVYSWQEGNLNLTIVSRLPLDDVRRIAASVK
jgi:negative regulator of sigma E activity